LIPVNQTILPQTGFYVYNTNIRKHKEAVL